jgi:NADH:ubiquinone oxidoreductase subunit 5 (subunit L)/multisubunit Na+/H+ antiporter MnhA subunit
MSVFDKSNSDLRKFGMTIAVGFAVLGAIFLWRDLGAWRSMFVLSGLLLVIALALPKILAPLEWVWMKVAHAIGIVVTYILLTLTFYLVITTVGLLMRLFGHDPMRRKFERDKKSYWIDVDPEGSSSRPDKPY